MYFIYDALNVNTSLYLVTSYLDDKNQVRQSKNPKLKERPSKFKERCQNFCRVCLSYQYFHRTASVTLVTLFSGHTGSSVYIVQVSQLFIFNGNYRENYKKIYANKGNIFNQISPKKLLPIKKYT